MIKSLNPLRLLLNLLDKVNLKELINIKLYQILAFNIYGKIKKMAYKNNKIKYYLLPEIKSLNYLIDHILW